MFGSELFSSLISMFIFYFLHVATKITRFSYSHINTELCQLHQLFIWLLVQATAQVHAGFSLHVILFSFLVQHFCS